MAKGGALLRRWTSRPRGFESHPVGCGMTRFVFGAWLSPVERCVRVAEVPGSNPGAPITQAA